MAILSCKNISFKYGTNELFADLSLDIAEGDFVGFLGCNGSGKSTLLKLLVNRLTPESGTISIGGKNVASLSSKELACEIGYLEQSPHDSTATVAEYVLMGALPRFSSHRFWFTKSEKNKADELLNEVGIYDLRHRSLAEVSGGERQLAQICRALMSDPKLLLLDEPVSHLDINHVEMVVRLLKLMQKKRNITVLTTLHDINLAYNCSDTLIVLDSDGSISTLSQSKSDEEKLSSIFDTQFSIQSNEKRVSVLPQWEFE